MKIAWLIPSLATAGLALVGLAKSRRRSQIAKELAFFLEEAANTDRDEAENLAHWIVRCAKADGVL